MATATVTAKSETKGDMEVAHGWVEVNSLHDNVRVKHITPAEAIVMRSQFGVKIDGEAKPTNPLTHLDVHPDKLVRSKDQEFSRLVRKFGSKLISKVFPGENPNIPLTFKEAGFEATEESEPKAGKLPEIIPLASLSKEETSDEESVVQASARVAQQDLVKQQSEQIAKLTELVTKLTTPQTKS